MEEEEKCMSEHLASPAVWDTAKVANLSNYPEYWIKSYMSEGWEEAGRVVDRTPGGH